MQQQAGQHQARQQRARQRALELLGACATPDGFLATTTEIHNYRRIWGRDGVICGLGALAAGDAALIEAFEATLRTLGRHQGRSGQLPSNVACNVEGNEGSEVRVSYGQKAGRVDATLWFVVGVGVIGRLAGREALVREQWPVLLRALEVVRAWEFNGRGLVYLPRAGDWADEYYLHGYVLYDQVLRIWAWREAARAARRLGDEGLAAELEQETALVECRVVTDFWPTAENAEQLYDGGVLRPHIDSERRHLLAAFEPAGAEERFDALGHALFCLLGLGSDEQRARMTGHARSLARHGLIPSFDPVIQPTDPEYALLEATAAITFRHQPGRYHNGGLWPMVNAFWVLAARAAGDDELADRLAAGITAAVARDDWAFTEFLDAGSGEAAGVAGQAWSAAAVLLAADDGLAGQVVCR